MVSDAGSAALGGRNRRMGLDFVRRESGDRARIAGVLARKEGRTGGGA